MLDLFLKYGPIIITLLISYGLSIIAIAIFFNVIPFSDKRIEGNKLKKCMKVSIIFVTILHLLLLVNCYLFLG